MRNFSIVIHEHMGREIPVNIRKPLADSDETLPSPKIVFFLPQYTHRSTPMY